MIQRMSKAEQNCRTQSGPKHCKKSFDLRCCLKTVSGIDEVTLDSGLFHTREAATGNDRSPMMEWHIGGTTSVDVDADLRHHRSTSSSSSSSSILLIVSHTANKC